MSEDRVNHIEEMNFLVEFFSKKKVVLEVTIDLDAMPGPMHNGEYTQEYIQNLLNSMIGHYNPVVEMLKNDRPILPNEFNGDYPGSTHNEENSNV
jgi:hypothetical protein